MWISNTAVTAFMVPIAQAVLLRLNKEMKESFSSVDKVSVVFTTSNNCNGQQEQVNIQNRITYVALNYLESMIFHRC